MPAFIAAQRLVALLLRLHQGAVVFPVGDAHRLGPVAQDLDAAEPLAERDVFLIGQMLGRKDQRAVFVEGVLDLAPFAVAHAAERNVGHPRAQGTVERGDIDHETSPRRSPGILRRRRSRCKGALQCPPCQNKGGADLGEGRG